MAKAVATFGVNPMLLGLARRRGPAGDRVSKVLREAVGRALLMWHREILPGHFEEQATIKYAGDYTPRAKHYKRRKQREKKHRKPMVFSKRMRDTVLGRAPTIKANVQGRSLRVQLRLAWHEHIKYWRGRRVTRRGATHNFDREMKAMNRADLEKIRRVIEETAMMSLGHEFKHYSQKIKRKRFAA